MELFSMAFYTGPDILLCTSVKIATRLHGATSEKTAVFSCVDDVVSSDRMYMNDEL
jgi:hypothetical protein